MSQFQRLTRRRKVLRTRGAQRVTLDPLGAQGPARTASCAVQGQSRPGTRGRGCDAFRQQAPLRKRNERGASVAPVKNLPRGGLCAIFARFRHPLFSWRMRRRLLTGAGQIRSHSGLEMLKASRTLCRFGRRLISAEDNASAFNKATTSEKPSSAMIPPKPRAALPPPAPNVCTSSISMGLAPGGQ